MARALLKAGYVVSGYDPAPKACALLKKSGGRPLASATAVARAAQIITSSQRLRRWRRRAKKSPRRKSAARS